MKEEKAGGKERRERVHFIPKEFQEKHKTLHIYMAHAKDTGKGSDWLRKPGCEQGQIP